MADDINLPNLVSHLQVNLGNTNGIVADATRQGSSVGAALGESMQRTLRNALDDIPEVELNGDTSELDRDLHRVRRDLQRLSERRIGVDISIEDALREMERLEPHLERLQRTHPSLNVVAAVGGALADLEELRLAAREVDETDVDIDVDVDSRDLDQLNRRFDGVRQGLSRITGLIGGLGKIAVPFAAAGAAVGTLAPLLAGVATALANIAPAAGLAATGVIAVGLANASLKIGLMGVEEALKSAFDPDGAEAYAEALKKLAPNARSFVETIKSLGPQFDKLKLRVQNNLFEGLGKTLKTTVKAIGPDLSLALTTSAGALNRMGRQVLNTATGLSKSGAFGKAIGSATTGLYNLIPLPATIAQGLIQVGAAAGPAFERLTKRGGNALDRLSARMTKAFESGGMERAIEKAIDLLGQLGRVVGNVGGTLGNIFGGLTSGGQGLFSTLETITGSLEDATGTAGFQRALKALSETMRTVATTVGPLLGQALAILGPVVEELAGPVQLLVTTLGDGLGQVLTALGPVLGSAAGAVGELVIAMLPFVELAAGLIAAVLPSLTPLFESLSVVIQEMAPFLEQLAASFGVQLLPILERLPEVLETVLPVFERAAAEIFPELTRILGILAPYLEDLAVELGELLVQLAPVMADFLEFSAIVIGKLVPVIGPILGGLIIALTGTLRLMVDVLEGTVLPALRTAGKVLTGDFGGALKEAGVDAGAMKTTVSGAFNQMAGNAIGSVARMASSVGQEAARAGARLYSGVMTGVNQVRTILGNLPSIARGAAAGLGSALVAAGAALIGGLISGISSKIGEVRSKLGELTSMIPDWKGPARKDATLLTPAGRSIIQGLIDGITATTPRLKSTLTAITNRIERAISINKTNKAKVGGLGALLDRVERDNKRLLSLAKARDKVAASLKAAQKKLDDIVSARAKKGADIQAGILGEANITSGFSLVNSVTAITVGLQAAVKKAQEFGANLAKLKKAGLRSDLLGDIADAGVDGGAATAAALAKATPAELKRINELQAQLAKAASNTGTTVAGALYDSGVKAAQGLVEGLKKQQGAIEKQMKKIAQAMLKAIRKALDMHSPSRKLRAVAEVAMEGMPQGFEAMRAKVARSAASVASAAVSAAQGVASVRPSIPFPGQLSAAYAGAGGGGDTTNNFYLQGSDATPDGIIRALSWRGLVGRRG
ncbi:hypothetical protein IFE09_27015 [Streptomyces microflavus]|nr:hypothetical protein [Streptomyces microflavus]QQZ56854.1 hypothetical protein IFE09_27015 [Streptomyces microflavus]